MVFRIETLGCKVNQYNSEWLRENLVACGWEEDKGGWMLLNGCVVTRTAERKSRQKIYQAIRNGEKVIVTGCFARYEREFPQVLSIPDYSEVVKFLTHKSPLIKTISQHSAHQRGWIKIQEGCPSNCSYCIVPMVRGKVYSRPMEEILEEVEKMEENFGEIVFTGTHLGIYGREWGGSLTELLREVLRRIKRARIRLSSIEIGEIEDSLVELFSHPLLCPHLHPPLQSGSNKILSLMGRHYTKEEYLKKVKDIQKKEKSIAFSTDIMVGFPFESDREFQETLNMMEEVDFLRVHVFPFSPRKGTKASFFEPVPVNIIKERVKIASQLAKEISYRRRQEEIGKVKEVIIESKDGSGYSEDYLWVKVTGENVSVGKKLKVRITKVTRDSTFGEVVNEQKDVPGRQCI